MSSITTTNQIIDEVKNYIFQNHGNNKISDSQMAMALKLCQEYNLSPLKREIHFLPFWNSTLNRNDLQPVIAYTEYIKKAQGTKMLDGYKYDIEWSADRETAISCTVTVHRKDWNYPFIHTVRFKEVAQKNKNGELNQNWKSKPGFMLMKVGISQAMRLAFPEELSAMPYEEGEAWNVVESNVVESIVVEAEEKPKFSQDNFDNIALLVSGGKKITVEQVKKKYDLDGEWESKLQSLLNPIDESEPIDLIAEIANATHSKQD